MLDQWSGHMITKDKWLTEGNYNSETPDRGLDCNNDLQASARVMAHYLEDGCWNGRTKVSYLTARATVHG